MIYGAVRFMPCAVFPVPLYDFTYAYLQTFLAKNTVKVESTELTASRHCDGIVFKAKFPEHDFVEYCVQNDGQGI